MKRGGEGRSNPSVEARTKHLMSAFKDDITPETRELTEMEIVAKYQLANRSVRGIVR